MNEFVNEITKHTSNKFNLKGFEEKGKNHDEL